MRALIFNNKVVDVKETEFAVHNSMTWVDCEDNIKIGFIYNDGVFTSPVVIEKTYDEVRKKAYPKLGNVIDAIFKKEAGNSTEWDAMVIERQTIKDANPKA